MRLHFERAQAAGSRRGGYKRRTPTCARSAEALRCALRSPPKAGRALFSVISSSRRACVSMRAIDARELFLQHDVGGALLVCARRSSFASLNASKARIISPCVTTASSGMPALVSSSVGIDIH